LREKFILFGFSCLEFLEEERMSYGNEGEKGGNIDFLYKKTKKTNRIKK
jgi:hypothetical protein